MMLKDSFPGHHPLDDHQLRKAWLEGRVVLDTNVLLGLYRYDEATRNDLLSVLKRVSTRLWMPYHVGLEYNRKRHSVISGEKRAFSKASANVSEYASKIAGVFSDKSRNPHPSRELSLQLAELTELAGKIAREVEALGSSLPDVNERDIIREEISSLYGEQIGGPPDKAWLENAARTAQQRIKDRVPPGFEDDKKSETFTDRGMFYEAQYGDIFVWLQILDEARASSWPAIILVTDDAKEDWWQIESGKKIGPRAELREEVLRVSGVPLFQSYSTAQFLEHANRQLDTNVSAASIALIREVAKPEKTHVSNFERMQRLAQSAVRRWLKSTTSDATVVIPMTSSLDYLIKLGERRHGVIIKFIPGPPSPEVGPYVLNSLARSYTEETFEMGVEYVDLFLVFQSRNALELHLEDLLAVTRELRQSEPTLRPKFGTLMRTVDGNHAFVPFHLGIFD